MHRSDGSNPTLGRAALMGLAVALPMAVAAETGAAAAVRGGDIAVVQRTESSEATTWAQRMVEAARNLLRVGAEPIALPVITTDVGVAEVCVAAVECDRGIDVQPQRLDHALIDLPPPTMV